MDEGIQGETNELNKPLNKSQCTLSHVGDRKGDERVRIQMSTKWQESSDSDAEGGRQTVKDRWVK